MTDTEYRRYTTAELRDAAKDKNARFMDRKGREWSAVRADGGYDLAGDYHPPLHGWDFTDGIDYIYRTCSQLASRKLRRIA